MNRPALFVLPVLLLGAAAPVDAQRQEPGGPPRLSGRGYADPSAVIAAEIELSRLEQEKGHWQGLGGMAAPNAVVATPALVLAGPWLKGRKDPAPAIRRNTQAVWMSCDGGLAVTAGAWTRAGTGGRYMTVWQRQPDGAWRWLAELAASRTQAAPDPDMIAATVADCPERPARAAAAPVPKPGRHPSRHDRPAAVPPEPVDPAQRAGRSPDGTLEWQVSVAPDGSRSMTARLMREGAMREIGALSQEAN